jgi:hypothetical protein
MIVVQRIHKRFSLYSDVMDYLERISLEYNAFGVFYEDEVYYSEVLNDYKVLIKIYGNRQRKSR